MEMFACEAKKCFFCVFTLKDFACIEINFDDNLVYEQRIPKAKLYVLKIALPEVLTRYWTKLLPEKNVPIDPNVVTTVVVTELNSAEPTCNPVNSPPSLPSCDETSTLITISQSYKCFCNGTVQIPVNNAAIVQCANDLCRAKVFHKFCLQKLGKKVFRTTWLCDACKDEKAKEKQRQKRLAQQESRVV